MKNENDRENLIYLAGIVLLIILLTFRVTSQGRSMEESIKKIQEEGVDISLESQDEKDLEREEEVVFERNFTTPDGKLSFDYPSSWQEIENDDILKLFQNPDQGEMDEHLTEEAIREESFEDIDFEDQNIEEDVIGEVLFMGMKTTFPNLSFGIISVQKLDKEIKTPEELKTVMSKDLEFEREDEKGEIVNSEKGSDFVILEVVTSTHGRSLFRSKNIGFLVEDSVFVISINAPYENWSDFENEFNMIISSVELND